MGEAIGFTLGKYSPFHKGHEFLIKVALSEMNRVIVIIYNASEVTSIPTEIRANWIRKIFPMVEVLIAEDGPQMVGYSDEVKRVHEDYLTHFLKDYHIHSFYSSEPYGEHISQALNCVNRIVDPNRNNCPVSATDIRANVIKYKHMVSDIVYQDIKPKIVFIGGPSSGKTTLAKLCSEKLQGDYCPEYGRTYWFEHQKNHRLSIRDLEVIAERQLESEVKASCGSGDRLFLDTTIITTLAYALYYFGKASSNLLELFTRSLYTHSIYLLCLNDIPFEDTWDRSGPGSREELQQLNFDLLDKYRIEYQVIGGSLAERVSAVQNILEENQL
ncbi:MAG: AAA family ATPase [Candidatus Cloacimonetes bacterium]|jgi:NadR type nicotinamide-nucleotide adenylyltransferase|nr:AAA family ATPase [Candidatus Cloacimonadota bacterium]MDY0172328.1 AAA family ATPase [Candidatus Cloacimonadaceae bacterium]